MIPFCDSFREDYGPEQSLAEVEALHQAFAKLEAESKETSKETSLLKRAL